MKLYGLDSRQNKTFLKTITGVKVTCMHSNTLFLKIKFQHWSFFLLEIKFKKLLMLLKLLTAGIISCFFYLKVMPMKYNRFSSYQSYKSRINKRKANKTKKLRFCKRSNVKHLIDETITKWFIWACQTLLLYVNYTTKLKLNLNNQKHVYTEKPKQTIFFQNHTRVTLNCKGNRCYR